NHQSDARTKPTTAGSRRRQGRGSSAARKAAARPVAVEVYAGPAFSVSPEPSSVPLPQFPFRKAAVTAAVDDAATRDLRRMLRLE
ncbi:proline-rich nuclear receptor coactivator motif-containing protein, partial [Shewanella sp. C32]|nr:proline-rich nuclear receptor coactivator motif-containing protein [Shewanella electrica]